MKHTNVAACVAGKTWGWDEKGIWVNQGCGGQFALDRGDTSAHRASAAPLRPASDQAQDRIEEAAPAIEESCEKAIGKKEAKKLVDECLQVSPATHPPCNAANSCALIKDEIKRSCDLIGKGAPEFCAEYREKPSLPNP